MKRLISLLVSISVILSLIVYPVKAVIGGDDAIPDSNDDAHSLEIIALVDPYICAVGNSLQLNLPTSVELNAFDLYKVQETLQLINNELAIGTLAVTENGTLYVPGDDELLVQGGNVNKVTWHWWGIRRYASRTKAAELANVLLNCSTATATASAVALSLVGYSGAVGLAVGLLNAFVSTKFAMMSNSLTYVNSLTSRGVIFDLRWFVTYRVVSQ